MILQRSAKPGGNVFPEYAGRIGELVRSEVKRIEESGSDRQHGQVVEKLMEGGVTTGESLWAL